MAETFTIKTFLGALAGSFLPALFWLWFWLKQDKRHPEPLSRIALAFAAGMGAVFLVYPIEILVYAFSAGIIQVLLIAATEELMKFGMLYTAALKSKYFDEPIDAVIYAITVALGFSALENLLYLVGTIAQDGTLMGAFNTNLRFVGATVLHTVSTAAIGVSIALSYYKKTRKKYGFIAVGILTALILHAGFNLSIMNTENLGDMLIVFAYLWVLAIILLLLFEKIKRIRPVILPKIRLRRSKQNDK